jgi:hypothetical protein
MMEPENGIVDYIHILALYIGFHHLNGSDWILLIQHLLCAIETITGHLTEEDFDLDTYDPIKFNQAIPCIEREARLGKFPLPLDEVWEKLATLVGYRLKTGSWFSNGNWPYNQLRDSIFFLTGCKDGVTIRKAERCKEFNREYLETLHKKDASEPNKTISSWFDKKFMETAKYYMEKERSQEGNET